MPPQNWIAAVRVGDAGLVPVVAQGAFAGAVLSVGEVDARVSR